MTRSQVAKDGGPLSRPVIFLADHDDPDIPVLRTALSRKGVSVKWLKLGLSGQEYSARWSLTDGVLEHDSITLSTKDIERASLIFYRRWKLSPPGAPIDLVLPGDPGRFAEREWTATLESLLWLWRHLAPATLWSNSPDAEERRLPLFHLAQQSGFNLPWTEVSTQFATDIPPSIVSKSIAVNEHIYGDMYFPTVLLDDDTVASLMTEQSPCPTLVQATVDAHTELRIAYCLGSVASVATSRPKGVASGIDIRFVPNLTWRRHNLPQTLEAKTQAFAHLARLELFTMDVLVDDSDDHWVVDITPSGLIGAYDDDTETLVSCCVEGILTSIDAP